MDSKEIATIVVFSALTVALNLSPVKIPAPYALFLIYQLWEIPIVAAFLLYGLRIGIAISLINTIVLLGVFPGELPTGPFYNLAAVLSMLLGIYIIHRLMSGRFSRKLEAISASVLGTLTRVGVMTVVNWSLLRYPPPIGFSMPVSTITVMLPLIVFFNATLALYTIPIGYILARTVSFRTNAPSKEESKGSMKRTP